MCAYLQHVAQEECKSLEEFSGIPVAKLRENDPSFTELKFNFKGFGDAEACVLGSVLQVRRKYTIGQPHAIRDLFLLHLLSFFNHSTVATTFATQDTSLFYQRCCELFHVKLPCVLSLVSSSPANRVFLINS